MLHAVPDITYPVIHVLQINANVRMAVARQVPSVLPITKRSVHRVIKGFSYQRMPVLKQDAMRSSMRAEMEVHVPIRPISVLTPVPALQVLLELIVKLRFRAAADHVKTVELARIQRISGPINVFAL